MMKQKHIVFVLISMIFGFSLFAQKEGFTDDAALWFGFSVKKKLNDRVTVIGEQKNRISNNFSEYSLGYADAGINYKINKFIRLQADYVWGKALNDELLFNTRNQFLFSFILKKNVGRFSLQFRNMFQFRYRNIFSSADGLVPTVFNRNKVTVKYEINKFIKAYVSEEIRYRFLKNGESGLNRSRTKMGAEYNWSKSTGLELYFLFQRQLNTSGPINRDFVYGIQFNHEF